MSLAATLPAHLRPRREKVFGDGRPRALDRNAKVRIMHQARALSRRTAKGKAYGPITAKALAVLEALLWGFHNARSGLCFPSYETIAAKAGCARSTVAEAIKALEEAGILSWGQVTKVHFMPLSRERTGNKGLRRAGGRVFRFGESPIERGFPDFHPRGRLANGQAIGEESFCAGELV